MRLLVAPHARNRLTAEAGSGAKSCRWRGCQSCSAAN